jgi:hypothetical protein
LREPHAYGGERFISYPLLNDLPWIPEFNFDLVGAAKLGAVQFDAKSLANELHGKVRYTEEYLIQRNG